MSIERAIAAHGAGRHIEAHALLVEHLSDCADPDAILLLADNLLYVCPDGGDPLEWRCRAAEHALAISRATGYRRGEARALLALAATNACHADECLAIAREIGDRKTEAEALTWLANHSSSPEAAAQAVALARETGDAELLFCALFVQGLHDDANRLPPFRELAAIVPTDWTAKYARRLFGAACLMEDADEAEVWLERCLPIVRQMEAIGLEGAILLGLAGHARRRGATARADDLEAIGRVLQGPLPDFGPFIRATNEQQAREALEALFRRGTPFN